MVRVHPKNAQIVIFSKQTWRLKDWWAANPMQCRAWNPVWKISAQLYSLRPSQNYDHACLIKHPRWKGTSTDLHPLPYMTDWSAQSGWESPGSAPSLSGCRGYGYVNLCSTGRVCFVSALEVAGCQLQSGSDVALISMVPRGFIVHSALLLSLFVPIKP